MMRESDNPLLNIASTIVDMIDGGAIVGTVVGGLILALILFWMREKLYPPPPVTGRWYFKMCTTVTDYKPYEEMILKYLAIVWREGNNIKGTTEKIHEKSSDGERKYVGKHRIRGSIEGCIEKRYFGKDLVFFHIVEDGELRQSTHFHQLTSISEDEMEGKFISTVANQEGKTVWKKNDF